MDGVSVSFGVTVVTAVIAGVVDSVVADVVAGVVDSVVAAVVTGVVDSVDAAADLAKTIEELPS